MAKIPKSVLIACPIWVGVGSIIGGLIVGFDWDILELALIVTFWYLYGYYGGFNHKEEV